MGNRAAQLLSFVLRSVARLLNRFSGVTDPWERVDNVRVPVAAFGPGSQHDFGWYFEGQSSVVVTSFEEVHTWLASCKYSSDRELFREADFWQHPSTFERLRSGDCEDFALWAWRKLLELGHDADFVVGRCSFDAATGYVVAKFKRHASIVFRKGGVTYVYEPTLQEPHSLQALDMVRHRYVPEYGVGPTRRTFAFCGRLLAMREADLRPVDEE